MSGRAGGRGGTSAAAGNASHDADGLYGPASEAWLLSREGMLLLGAGPRSILLQIAHPLIAEGVDQHSAFRIDPWARLIATVRSYLTVVYGSGREARAEIARLNRLHRSIEGPVRDPEAGLSSWRDPEEAIASMYQDCDPEDARWAVGRLRGQSGTPHARPWPLEAVPDTERTYIVGRQDNTVNPDWSCRAAPDRLGVSPVEIDGGHSPFLGRPAELARLLAGLA